MNAQEWYADHVGREDELAIAYADLGERPEVPASAYNEKVLRGDPKTARMMSILHLATGGARGRHCGA